MSADYATIPVLLRPALIIIQQNPFGIAIRIIILAAVESPEQNPQSAQAHHQRGCDDKGDAVHDGLPAARRSAFSVTNRDEPAMVAAATIGVTRPLAAMGIAVRL